jgi:hypothetical protein
MGRDSSVSIVTGRQGGHRGILVRITTGGRNFSLPCYYQFQTWRHRTLTSGHWEECCRRLILTTRRQLLPKRW